MKNRRGFTLIEILIVVAILALLSITGILSLSKNRTKAEDVSMKNDLSRLKTAFEEYYNDHNCYPPAEWFDSSENITGDELSPYLNRIPFNKKTSEPYVLEKDTTGCNWFKIYTTLSNPDDPQAVLLRTTDPLLGSTLGNYGVSSSNTTVRILYAPTTNNNYYCQGQGNCSQIPSGQTCSPSYPDPNCGNSNLCENTVSTCN